MSAALNIAWTLLSAALVIAVLGWLVFRTVKNAEDPPKMILKWCGTVPAVLLCLFAGKLGFMGPAVIVVCAVVLSAMWTPHLGAAFIKPLTSLIDGGDEPPDPTACYSIARARQKRGEYLEAVASIRKQLARFPTDVEGNLLLAEIQAENLKDLPAAELTIQRFCEQPGHAPQNIVFALYSMADWHLKVGRDREAAQQDLERVIELLPDTEFSLGAAQRIAHLGMAEMVLAPDERKKFIVPEGVRYPALARKPASAEPTAGDPEEMAAQYVRHLEQHPLDADAREKLAAIYVDHYKRLDLATVELEQLITQPNQPGRLVVHWLNQLADLQIRGGATQEEVRQTLQRIIDRDPNLAAAEIARKRLALLKLEFRANEKTEGVKLGQYEQNIGLKRQAPTGLHLRDPNSQPDRR